MDLGPRRLRDVPIPVGVFQIRAPGLRTDFPPLRGVDSNPGNLRPAITSLIGRDAEVSNLQAALRSHRLVTLTGVGGVGKTRLALEVATQLADEFVDGVWVFELAAVADPAAVPDAVAAVLGITQQPGKSVSESVASALEGRSRLLVFDNCEHVVDSVADLVAAILAASATVKVLATSREGIGVADEYLWRVPSLDVGAAVELFVERAQSMVSDTLADEATAVEDVCRRLDGIPLAIELAASRMASMTAGEVRDRLDDRFRLLVGSRRGLERHQTLRHAVAWSYDLLDDAEKTVLERCSVFAGGFDLQSACAVAGFDDSTSTPSWICWTRWCASRSSSPTGHRGGPGFRCWRRSASSPRSNSSQAARPPRSGPPMLATSPGEKPTSWPCGTAPDSGRLTTGSPPSWPTCAPRSGGPPTTATSTSPPPSPPTRRSSVSGSKIMSRSAWAEELIEPARAVDHPRLGVLYVIASMCWIAGRIEAAVGYSEAGQKVLGRGRDEVPFGIEGWLGGAYLCIGQPERWAEWCRAELARGRETHASPGHAWSSHWRWPVAGDEAMAAANGLIEAAEATRNPCALSFALLAYGYAFGDADPARALDALRRGLVIAQDSGNRYNESTPCGHAGPPRGRPRRSAGRVRLLHVWRSATPRLRQHRQIRAPLAILAAFLDRLGRHEPAATIAGFAVQPLHRTRDPRDRHRDRPPPRRARRPDLRIARPQGRDDDHRRNGDVRLRPNRPGPSRTERCLGIEDANVHCCLCHRVHKRLRQAKSVSAATRIYVEVTANRCHSPGTPLSW